MSFAVVVVVRLVLGCLAVVFFFNDPATTEIYTLSLHDALPIFPLIACQLAIRSRVRYSRSEPPPAALRDRANAVPRSEEHTSELQSQSNLVCRLLLEKKKRSCMDKGTQYPHSCRVSIRA